MGEAVRVKLQSLDRREERGTTLGIYARRNTQKVNRDPHSLFFSRRVKRSVFTR